MGLSSVVFELDAKIVVEYGFHSIKSDDSDFGVIIKDCRFLCQHGSHFSVHFVRRQANKATRALAKESYVRKETRRMINFKDENHHQKFFQVKSSKV